ncbi:MAG: diacylglycerol kinase family protein [Oscillospiraceae bacterium]|nr:diacylglycerol kinase family protein [Oscillospiraceae bacterium]
MKKFFKSFKYAAHGVAEACKQRNFRFHICAMVFVIFFAARFYGFTAERWAILLLTCAGALALEAVNTGLERLADKVTEEHSHRIRLAKDCAAGAVLIWAVFAVVIGVLLFWDNDKFELVRLYFSEYSRLAALILAIALAWGFVFLPEYISDKKDK